MVYCCKCGGAPEIIRVGDQKEYFLVRCSKCYHSTNKYDEASLTESHALRVWYRVNREHSTVNN